MFLMALSLAAVEPPPRPMEVEVIRDAITDEIRAYATLREDGHRLVVSCEPGRYRGARISVHSRRWLARGGPIAGDRRVTYRFDDHPPARTLWDVEDRRARIEGRAWVDSFLGYLAQSERLVIRARDIENRRFDMSFRLAGVRPALEHALAACAAAPEA